MDQRVYGTGSRRDLLPTWMPLPDPGAGRAGRAGFRP